MTFPNIFSPLSQYSGNVPNIPIFRSCPEAGAPIPHRHTRQRKGTACPAKDMAVPSVIFCSFPQFPLSAFFFLPFPAAHRFGERGAHLSQKTKPSPRPQLSVEHVSAMESSLICLSYISDVGNTYSLLSIVNFITSSTEQSRIVHSTPMVWVDTYSFFFSRFSWPELNP